MILKYFYIPQLNPIYIILLLLIIIAFFFVKKTGKLLLYVGILFIVCILSRSTGHYGYNLDSFWKYKQFLQIGFSWWDMEVLYNIVMTIPLGYLLYDRLIDVSINHHKLYTLLLGACISLCIELTQFITHTGTFETNDIVNNTLGVLLGMFICIIYKRIEGYIKK